MTWSHSFRWAAPFVALAIPFAVPASANAAAPEIFHGSFLDVVPDVEVCGINVDVVSRGVFTDKLFLDDEGNVVAFMSSSSGTNTFTADNGKSVVVQFANMVSDGEPIVDEEAGTITFVTTFTGLPEKIKTPQGAVILRDAGIIAFADTFDLETGDFISSDVIVKGPHPEADSDFVLFCEVITAALA
jgi:hypothetical protein